MARVERCFERDWFHRYMQRSSFRWLGGYREEQRRKGASTGLRNSGNVLIHLALVDTQANGLAGKHKAVCFLWLDVRNDNFQKIKQIAEERSTGRRTSQMRNSTARQEPPMEVKWTHVTAWCRWWVQRLLNMETRGENKGRFAMHIKEKGRWIREETFVRVIVERSRRCGQRQRHLKAIARYSFVCHLKHNDPLIA